MKWMPALRPERTRVAIMATLIALYSAVLALVTVQALNGESLVRPSAPTISVASVLALVGASTVTVVVVGSRGQHGRALQDAGR